MTLPHTDTHIHATCYRAVGAKPEVTVPAILERCVDEGIARVGIVEHLGGPKHPQSCLLDLAHAFRRHAHPVRAALGVEVNMTDESGALSATSADRDEAGLDFVLAGIHWTPPHVETMQQSLAYNHHVIMAALEHNPWIDVVAHPWRPARHERLRPDGTLWRFASIPDDLIEEFVDALAAHGVAYELHHSDAGDLADPAFVRLIRLLLERHVPIAVGSDTHNLDGIGRTRPLHEFLESQGLGPEQIWFPLP